LDSHAIWIGRPHFSLLYSGSPVHVCIVCATFIAERFGIGFNLSAYPSPPLPPPPLASFAAARRLTIELGPPLSFKLQKTGSVTAIVVVNHALPVAKKRYTVFIAHEMFRNVAPEQTFHSRQTVPGYVPRLQQKDSTELKMFRTREKH
jgi:hypothetical protein